MRRVLRPAALAVATITGLLVVLGLLRAADPLREGLTATYFADTSWASSPVRSIVERAPSTDSIDRAWGSRPPRMFSATWTGSLCVLRGGTYTFATHSDDGSWLYVDGTPVVDNGGGHAAKTARGTVTLERGVHEIFIKYFQEGGSFELSLWWARDGGALEPIPAWAFSTRETEFRRALASVLLRWLFDAARLAWPFGLIVVGIGIAWQAGGTRARSMAGDPIVRALLAVIVASMAINACGLWWGLPSQWAGDEILPDHVLDGLSQSFAHGWFDRYPPFHFYLLSVVLSPWLLLKSFGWFHLPEQTDGTLMLVLTRLVSVAAGAGTLAAVYACGARVFGRRAGVLAAAMMATLSTFVFYSKFANPEIPYVFWFALSLVFFARFMDTLATRDVVLFACAATLAVCTKDQAYGLYGSAPFVLVYRIWRANRDAGRPSPLARAVVDWRLAAGAAAAAVLFGAIYLVPFNTPGLVAHVRDITGAGSQGYREFDRGVTGQLRMLALTADLDVRSWGWPFLVIAIAGVVVAVRDRRTRFAAVWLALSAAAYYAAFLCVILYNYDRYLLPICVVQAIFGGLAVDRLLRWRPAARPIGAALTAAAFAYTLLYSGTIDVLMLRDSRYAAEDWLRAHAGASQIVATVFPDDVLPRLESFSIVDVANIEGLEHDAPPYYLLNADYARAVTTTEPDRPLASLITGLERQTLGYRLAFRYRAPSPWPWLPGGHPDLVGPRDTFPVASILRDINPLIEIYERAR